MGRHWVDIDCMTRPLVDEFRCKDDKNSLTGSSSHKKTNNLILLTKNHKSCSSFVEFSVYKKNLLKNHNF